MMTNNFDIDDNSNLIVNENGNKYYNIPSNINIYRGGNAFELQNNSFFGFDMDHVKQYGSVSMYTTDVPLQVLALMEMDRSSNFYKEAPEDIQQALDKSFFKKNEKGEQLRISEPKYDYAVVNYLCAKGYEGYAMNSTKKTESGAYFHAELVICNCNQGKQKITLTRRNEIKEAPRMAKTKRKNALHSPIYTNDEDNENVSKRLLFNFPKSLFQDDDDDKDGGTKKKTNKSTNKKTNKSTNKKTNKGVKTDTKNI